MRDEARLLQKGNTTKSGHLCVALNSEICVGGGKRWGKKKIKSHLPKKTTKKQKTLRVREIRPRYKTRLKHHRVLTFHKQRNRKLPVS